MSAIFSLPSDPVNPIRLVNVQTLGALCGRFPSHAAAERYLHDRGYSPDDYWREGNTVCFKGGINC